MFPSDQIFKPTVDYLNSVTPWYIGVTPEKTGWYDTCPLMDVGVVVRQDGTSYVRKMANPNLDFQIRAYWDNKTKVWSYSAIVNANPNTIPMTRPIYRDTASSDHIVNNYAWRGLLKPR